MATRQLSAPRAVDAHPLPWPEVAGLVSILGSLIAVVAAVGVVNPRALLRGFIRGGSLLAVAFGITLVYAGAA